jgi:hypothetical protein
MEARKRVIEGGRDDKKVTIELHYTIIYEETKKRFSKSEYLFMILYQVYISILDETPGGFKKFSIKAFLVLLLNSFPRGKAKAPSFTLPSEELNPASILKSIQAARTSIEALAKAGKNQYFTHPIFGDLNSGQTFKFLGVHTNHHLKIIKDIMK